MRFNVKYAKNYKEFHLYFLLGKQNLHVLIIKEKFIKLRKFQKLFNKISKNILRILT